MCGRDKLHFLYFADQKITIKELFQINLSMDLETHKIFPQISRNDRQQFTEICKHRQYTQYSIIAVRHKSYSIDRKPRNTKSK